MLIRKLFFVAIIFIVRNLNLVAVFGIFPEFLDYSIHVKNKALNLCIYLRDLKFLKILVSAINRIVQRLASVVLSANVTFRNDQRNSTVCES